MPKPNAIILSRCAWTLYNFRRNLALNLQQHGITTILAGSDEDGFDTKLRKEGHDFRPIPISLKGVDPLRDFLLILELRKFFKRTSPQLLHAFTIKPAIYGTLAAWMAGVPHRIVTISGIGHAFTTGKPWLRTIVELLYRFALRRADIVFFQNKDDRDLFLDRRLVAPGKVRLIAGSGVDVNRFTPQPLPSKHGDTPRFLMISRLLKEKGIKEYITAAEAVQRHSPQASFQLLGGLDTSNPSGVSLEEFHKMNHSKAVEWIDKVDDVLPYIKNADVIVLPSYREGVPRSLLEGAAMARALVASDAPGCRDIVHNGSTGYLVPIGDAQALAKALTRLIENPSKIAEMGQSARQMVLQQFDERFIIDQTIAVYQETLAKKNQSFHTAS